MSEQALVAVTQSRMDDMTALAEMTKVGDYLPYIQLCGSSTTLFKEGKIPLAHFALVKGKGVTDLTKEFHAVVLSWRTKAMCFGDMEISYDRHSESFKKIQAAAAADSQSGNGYGPEYLLWLPEYKQFGTYFMSSATARNEAPNTQTFLGRACTFESVLIKNKKYSWHGPSTKKCPLTEVAMPEEANRLEVTSKFENPPVPEAAESSSKSRD